MKFETYIPSDILKPFISSLVISEADMDNSYTVMPGTGPVIGFQYKGILHYIREDQEIPLSVSGITGMHDQYRVFRHTGPIGSVLVYFKPGGAAVFFRTPIHELFRESISLDHFLLRSELLILEEQLAEAKSDQKRIDRVERFLVSNLQSRETDPMVLSALAMIYQSGGNIRITELTTRLHTSQSPLEKKFRQIVGISPKKFSSIVRMKQALKGYDPKNSLTGLGYEAGFYDQAHFIKEFKQFTGQTPQQFFTGSGE